MDSTCVDKLTKNEHILVASILQKGEQSHSGIE